MKKMIIFFVLAVAAIAIPSSGNAAGVGSVIGLPAGVETKSIPSSLAELKTISIGAWADEYLGRIYKYVSFPYRHDFPQSPQSPPSEQYGHPAEIFVEIPNLWHYFDFYKKPVAVEPHPDNNKKPDDGDGGHHGDGDNGDGGNHGGGGHHEGEGHHGGGGHHEGGRPDYPHDDDHYHDHDGHYDHHDHGDHHDDEDHYSSHY